jgi:sugar/nucleoside kinase (ribokinase family)
MPRSRGRLPLLEAEWRYQCARGIVKLARAREVAFVSLGDIIRAPWALGAMVSKHALCIGNFTLDLTPDGETPGGSVYYSGATFAALGVRPRIVAAAHPDFPVDRVRADFDFDLQLHAAAETTAMRNTYHGSVRTQVLKAAGESLAVEDVPQGWADGAIVLLCPVFGEVDDDIARGVRGAVTGASLQGWLRRADSEQSIRGTTDTAFLAQLAGVDALLYSDEDVAHAPEIEEAFRAAAPVTVRTHGPAGATVYAGGRSARIPGQSVDETDPTGAGDTFAGAFLTHLAQNNDPFAAAEFGCRVAAIEVSHRGPLTPSLLREHGYAARGDLPGEREGQ